MHIIANHYERITNRVLHKDIKQFLNHRQHFNWVAQVGRKFLNQKSLSVGEFCSNIQTTGVKLNELGILLIAQMYRFHIAVIMRDWTWTTGRNLDLSECKVVLAFLGKSNFMDTYTLPELGKDDIPEALNLSMSTDVIQPSDSQVIVISPKACDPGTEYQENSIEEMDTSENNDVSNDCSVHEEQMDISEDVPLVSNTNSNKPEQDSSTAGVSRPSTPALQNEQVSRLSSPAVQKDQVSRPSTPAVQNEQISRPSSAAVQKDQVSRPSTPAVQKDQVSRPSTPAVQSEQVSRPSTPVPSPDKDNSRPVTPPKTPVTRKSQETLNLPQLVIKLQCLEDRIDKEGNKS